MLLPHSPLSQTYGLIRVLLPRKNLPHCRPTWARSRSQSFATLDSPTPLLPPCSWLPGHSYHPTLGIATPYRYSQSPSHVSIVRVLRNNASRQATFRFWLENLRIGTSQVFCNAKGRLPEGFFFKYTDPGNP